MNDSKTYKTAHAVIFRAESDKGPWRPITAEEVPNWVKDPDVMGQLILNPGLMCNDPTIGPGWYRAERMSVDLQ